MHPRNNKRFGGLTVIEKAPQSSGVSWVAIAGLMISGTVAFVGFWIQFSGYHEISVSRIVTLEVTMKGLQDSASAHEKIASDLAAKVAEIKGELDVLRHEHENLERTLLQHIENDYRKRIDAPELSPPIDSTPIIGYPFFRVDFGLKHGMLNPCLGVEIRRTTVATEALQQTAATREMRYDLQEALWSKTSPAEAEKRIAEYFAEKAAKAARRDARMAAQK